MGWPIAPIHQAATHKDDLKILLLTDCPSPYQVELFNEIESQGQCSLEVAYLRSHDPNRQWKPVDIRHTAIQLNGSSEATQRARQSVRNADLVVFNYYRHANAETLISERAHYGSPWCFWGERPGFQQQPAWAGRLFRKWKLARLHAERVPIWGIGKFAIDGYKREFGDQRSYFNLPYFSDLQRFQNGLGRGPRKRTFLFSGSLIRRKGIDLLAQAFVRLAQEYSHVQLRIVGDGELRDCILRVLEPVSEHVQFVGFRDWDQTPFEYSQGDILVVPSRYDGWGLVVPEGLASGLPVIATDRTGAALEFVVTGLNGWLVPAGDQKSLLNAMRQAVSLPADELSNLSQQARESVREHTLTLGAVQFAQFCRMTLGEFSRGNTEALGN